MVDGDGLENRCAKAPGVRIPLSPPSLLYYRDGKLHLTSAVVVFAASDRTVIKILSGISAWRSTQEAEGAPLLRE